MIFNFAPTLPLENRVLLLGKETCAQLALCKKRNMKIFQQKIDIVGFSAIITTNNDYDIEICPTPLNFVIFFEKIFVRNIVK